jgi:hypothetical protein
MSLTCTRGLGRLEAGNINVSRNLKFDEIRAYEIDHRDSHLQEAILSCMVFHGKSRPKFPESVIGHDLVLTTYATLVADSKGSKVLQNVA